MPTVESIESWRGQDVLDSAGEKAGRLEEVYYDAAGDEPVLISIKHGRLGHQAGAASEEARAAQGAREQAEAAATDPGGTLPG